MSNEQLDLILAHQIERRAALEGERDVVTFENGDGPDEVRSYRMLLDNGRRVAAALADEGMAKGERFALLMQNHPEFIDTMVGSSIVGTVYVPIDPRTKGDKLLFMLVHSGCKGIVCGDYCLPAVLDILDRAPQIEWLWVLGQAAPTLPRALRQRAFAEILRATVPAVAIAVNDPAEIMQIMYTSGTTGDPKGVVVRHARWGAVGNWSSFFGFGRDDRPYTGLSLTHGNAQLMTLASSLRLGMRAVFSRKFTKSRLWDIARKYGCTTFNLLGGMTTAIYSENPRRDDADNPVRFVISAGMPAAIWRDFERRFDVQVLEVYAAVEGGLTINPIGVGPVGSIGKPPPGLLARIVDPDDGERDVAPFEHGEIIFRPAAGPAPVVDYFRNPEASAGKTAGGWLRMGDIGHFDDQGWMYFDYRVGGGLRHNGEFVSTDFVEKAIAESPLVADVFVYGVPAASGAPGEKDVVAAVVLTTGTRFADAGLFAWCRQKLDSGLVPSYFQVVDEIPKTASEKPLERILLQEFSPTAANVFSQ